MVNVSSMQVAAQPADSLALVDLFQQTDGANWLGTWDLSQPVSSWQGVLLNSQGQVTAISLPNNGLAGTLSMLNLPRIESINLDNNSLTGAIPSFASHPNLKTLILSNNLFSHCPALVGSNQWDTLDLHGNQLSFDDIIPNISINPLSYSPQASTPSMAISVPPGTSVEIHFPIDLSLIHI